MYVKYCDRSKDTEVNKIPKVTKIYNLGFTGKVAF